MNLLKKHIERYTCHSIAGWRQGDRFIHKLRLQEYSGT